MSAAWVTVIALAIASAAIRAVGPLALGGRDLPERLRGPVGLLAPALLSALIVVETLADERAIEIDARLAGVAAAGAVLAIRRSAMLATIAVAAAVTALLRAL